MCDQLDRILEDGGFGTVDLSFETLVSELAGEICRCGGKKQPKKTFCAKCYYRLPKELRGRLYQRMGDGYEVAYGQAVKYLLSN